MNHTARQSGRTAQARNRGPRRIRFERLEPRTLLAITATKEDALLPADDLNGNGLVDPGEAITYTIAVSNSNGPPADGLQFKDTPDPNTTLIPGSVTTTVGTVTSGNLAGQTMVGVDLGSFTAVGLATIKFKVLVNPSLPAGVSQVSNQGNLDFAAPVNTPVLGQCYNTSSSSNLPLGQQFQAANSMVSYVDLFIEDAGSDIGPGANLQVRLRAGSITGPIVATSVVTFVPDGTNTGGGSTVTRFNFAAPVLVPLTAGVVFEIVQVGSIVPGNFNFSMCGVTTNSYPGGQAIRAGVLQPNTDFWFRIGDSAVTRDPAVVGAVLPTVTPVQTNAAPAAQDDAATTDEDTPVLIPLLANDSDPDGDPLSLQVTRSPAHGTLAPAPGGALTYIPAADYFGPDSFAYVASDGSLLSAPANVSLTVLPINDPPVLDDAAFTLDENSRNGTVVGTLTAADVDGDPIAYSILAGNSAGAFAIDPLTGVIRVADSTQLDFETQPAFSLTVQAADGAGGSDTADAEVQLRDVSEIVPLLIDIRPGNSANEINVKSGGKLDVLIYSTSTFDAQSIDIGSIRFGRTGSEDSLSRNAHGPRYRMGDFNGDGRPDLLVTVEIERTGFLEGDSRGFLTAQSLLGEELSGSDLVAIRKPGK